MATKISDLSVGDWVKFRGKSALFVQSIKKQVASPTK